MRGWVVLILSPWRHGIKKFEINFYLDLSIKTFSVFMSCKECFIEYVSKFLLRITVIWMSKILFRFVFL